MTNGAALIVAEQVLFRCQTQAPRRAKAQGRIMLAPMASPTGEAAELNIGIPFPGLRGKLRQYGRMFRPLHNPLKPARAARASNATSAHACSWSRTAG